MIVILVKSLSSHGNRWKQAATTDDNIDVEESKNLIVVPAGFVDDVAEMLGNLSLLNAPAAHTVLRTNVSRRQQIGRAHV